MLQCILLSRTPDQIPAYGEIHSGEHGMIAHVSTLSLTLGRFKTEVGRGVSELKQMSWRTCI